VRTGVTVSGSCPTDGGEINIDDADISGSGTWSSNATHRLGQSVKVSLNRVHSSLVKRVQELKALEEHTDTQI
jgi:hypothetical protein